MLSASQRCRVVVDICMYNGSTANTCINNKCICCCKRALAFLLRSCYFYCTKDPTERAKSFCFIFHLAVIQPNLFMEIHFYIKVKVHNFLACKMFTVLIEPIFWYVYLEQDPQCDWTVFTENEKMPVNWSPLNNKS